MGDSPVIKRSLGGSLHHQMSAHTSLWRAGISLAVVQAIISVFLSKSAMGSEEVEWSAAMFTSLSALSLTATLSLIMIVIEIAEPFSKRLFRSSNHVVTLASPWLCLSLIHFFYLGLDLRGATYKLSKALHLKEFSWFIHYVTVIAFAVALPIITLCREWFSEKMGRQRGVLHCLCKSFPWSQETTLRFIYFVLAFITISLNEMILEGDYYGLHFWLTTVSLYTLFSLFNLQKTSTNEPQELKHRAQERRGTLKCFTLSLGRHTRYFLLSVSLIVLTILSAQALSQGARQSLQHQETAFGLKLWGTLEAYLSTSSEEPLSDTSGLIHEIGDPLKGQLKGKGQSSALVILLTIDSLASERFTQSKTPPELKTLTELSDHRKVWYTPHLFSASTSTRFTLGSFIFGEYPHLLKWTRDRATHPSLATELRLSLWEKLGKGGINSTYLATVSDVIRRSNGLARGIKEIVTLPPESGQRVAFSPRVISELLPRLERALKTPKGSIFFSHLLDAHHPFDGGELKKGRASDRQLSELKIIDQQLKRLVDWIEARDDRHRIWLVISSDHGQGFGRHHIRTHNGAPYEHQARVPLWVYYGGSKQRHSQERALWESAHHWSSIDLHNTLLDLFGVSRESSSQGESWWPYWSAMISSHKGESAVKIRPLLAIADERLKDRSLLSVNWYTRALYLPESDLKLIEDTRAKTRALFSLKEDPLERTNLCDSLPQKCAKLNAQLKRLILERGGRQPIHMTRRD